MADAGLKGMLGAIVVGGAIALIGATTQPFWWCSVFTCKPKDDPTPIATSLPPVGTTTPTPAATPFKPHMGALMMATNLQGADLNDGEIVANAEACRALCDADETCMAMTYVMPDTQHRENGHCWLKGGKPTSSSNNYMISAIKITD